MAQTIAEKLLSRAAGRPVRPGELGVFRVDAVMATDTTAPLALRAFRAMGGTRPHDPARTVLVVDHASPAPNERIANLQAEMRRFARETGCRFFDVGAGIGHHVMLDEGLALPGELVLGADSHTTTYGAWTCFGTGVGSTDLAAAMLTGKTWLKVPASLRVRLEGRLAPGVTAKDLVLRVAAELGIAGGTYFALEYTGSAVAGLGLHSRIALANMAVEMGAKAGLVDPAGLMLPDSLASGEPVGPDPGATYARTLTLDVDALRPQIARPHSPDRGVDVDAVEGTRVDYAFIGSCTNARAEDLRAAAAVLRGRHIAPHVRMVVAPASRRVLEAIAADGTLAALSQAGATFITPGCGPCVGTHQGVPADAETVISAANRNFRGRMGNPRAEIYLASPVSVAAAALAGEIVDPARVLPPDADVLT